MTMATVLWIVAVILVIAGIFAIIRRQVLWGVVLIVVGLWWVRRRQHLHLTSISRCDSSDLIRCALW